MLERLSEWADCVLALLIPLFVLIVLSVAVVYVVTVLLIAAFRAGGFI